VIVGSTTALVGLGQVSTRVVDELGGVGELTFRISMGIPVGDAFANGEGLIGSNGMSHAMIATTVPIMAATAAAVSSLAFAVMLR